MHAYWMPGTSPCLSSADHALNAHLHGPPHTRRAPQIPPVCLAAASGHSGLVAALKARGAVLEPLAASDSVKRNALHYAAAKGAWGRGQDWGWCDGGVVDDEGRGEGRATLRPRMGWTLDAA